MNSQQTYWIKKKSEFPFRKRKIISSQLAMKCNEKYCDSFFFFIFVNWFDCLKNIRLIRVKAIYMRVIPSINHQEIFIESAHFCFQLLYSWRVNNHCLLIQIFFVENFLRLKRWKICWQWAQCAGVIMCAMFVMLTAIMTMVLFFTFPYT